MSDMKNKGRFHLGFCLNEADYDQYVDRIADKVGSNVIVSDEPYEYPVLCISIVDVEYGTEHKIIDTFFLYNEDLYHAFVE